MDSDWKKQHQALMAARAYIGGLLDVLSDRFIGHSHELNALANAWEAADEAANKPPEPNEDRLWWLRDELREILKREPTNDDLREAMRRCLSVDP